MVVTLIGRKALYKINLPQVPIGGYWLSDRNYSNEKKLLNIEGINGNWQVSSNEYAIIVDPNSIKNNGKKLYVDNNPKIIQKIILKEYTMYYVVLAGSNEVWVLYSAPTYEQNIIHLDMKNNREITIGNKQGNDIVYSNPLIRQFHAKITFFNGRLMLEKNPESFYGIFVNGDYVEENTKVLSNGDVIFIMGLKIIIMGRTIFINNLVGRIKYDPYKVIEPNKPHRVEGIREEDDSDLEIYSEKDYFSRAPRIASIIEHEVVKIDAPPSSQDADNKPLLLILGSTVSMGILMIISSFMSNNSFSGRAVFSIIITVIMLLSMMLFPVLNIKYDKKLKEQREKKRQEKYRKYIKSKSDLIDSIMTKQKRILTENYVSADECARIILSRSPRLWERKIEDKDFLTVNIGVGDVQADLDIQYPEEHFTLDEDNLMDILNEIVDKSKFLKDAPIVMSLVQKNVSALFVQNNESIIEKFMQNLIIQLVTFQSYEDLKLVFLLKNDTQKKWDYVKMFPHVWNNTKDIRFFADDYNDMKEISLYLEEDLRNRIEHPEDGYKSHKPYYLIITDDFKKIESLKIITEILKTKLNLGFSLFCITSDLMQLPNECKTFIKLNDSEGTIFESELSSTNQKKFRFDLSQTFFFEKISSEFINIPIKYTTTDKALLPNSYTFLEMYDVGRIEQLNILERWKANDSVMSLSVPIGVDASKMPIWLDIHEKSHGPHGLIAGSTGSGKSEFIITYILSLAINYHPEDVAFILIDYKGGGLAGAFQKPKMKLPHLVGTITNIDTAELQRSLASIQSELRKRERIFNEAKNEIDEGTMDIYKYQRLYHDGVVKTAIPHLLIICDEFAELKQQQPDFMDELISVSRIGRSLGVHLILATQRPAGIVNDQIRSNCNFEICLKVQDKSDSMDVIKRPDAANLKQVGQFYMRVGNDEYFTLGQSAWSGAPYFPTYVTKKKVDNSISFISNIGSVIKEVGNTSSKANNSEGEQLTNIVKYLHNLAKNENIESKQLWLDNIPENIYVDELRKKYNIKENLNEINPIIGEYDDPFNQRQGVVKMQLSNLGNAIVYGSADSGKETLLSTLVYDTITTHSPEEVQMYILDFGREALKIFKSSPNVGDVIFTNDSEKLARLFDMLQREIKNRTSILSDYNGDYNFYLKSTKKSMPMIVVIINNYEVFSELYQTMYEDLLLTITRDGLKNRIVFVLTVSTAHDIRYRLSQNFKQRFVLQLNKDDEYMNILEGVGRKKPAPIFGRGLVNLGSVYEFQTAKICKAEDWNPYITSKIDELNKEYKTHASVIPTLPTIVTIDDVKAKLDGLNSVPIGIERKSLSIFNYNFEKDFLTLITAKSIDLTTDFILNLLNEINELEDVNIVVLDAERIIQSNKNALKNNYEDLIRDLSKKQNNNNSVLCVIVGIDKLLGDLENGDNEFENVLKKAEESGRYSFIIVEGISKIKNYQYNNWYKKYFSGDTGIWIGGGIKEQYILNIDSSYKDTSNSNEPGFGYVIQNSIPTQVKLLGLKGDDEDE